ncbi:MAG: hypothetical protein WCA89_12515 [Terracidiphilus sp.]
MNDLVRNIRGLDWITVRVSNGNETRTLYLFNLQMPLEIAHKTFPSLGGQSFRTNERPRLLAEPVRILQAEHSHLAHYSQSDCVILYDRNFGLDLGFQLIRVATCQRGEAGKYIALAAFFRIELDSSGGSVSRMHKDANEECYRHAKGRTAGYYALPLPGNNCEIPERHLILGIEEAAAFGEPVSGAASLSFILFGQVDSSSLVLWPLAGASWNRAYFRLRGDSVGNTTAGKPA